MTDPVEAVRQLHAAGRAGDRAGIAAAAQDRDSGLAGAEAGVAQITYPRLRELLDAGAQLVEVLPEPRYAEAHLPGASNIPLKALDADSTAGLDRTKAVVVYCSDGL
jgi:3-mercaptopyruvate sulfurtransferase SseA